MPRVYYVGLLAGQNDMALLERTQVGRDINRHYCDTDEIGRQLQRPLVQQLFRLMRWRNTRAAFAGEFSLPVCADRQFITRWTNGAAWAELSIDFSQNQAEIAHGTSEIGDRWVLFG